MDHDTIERLIECVKCHVFLYDVSHKEYKNVSVKDATWCSIGKKLNKPGKAVKYKWRTVRDGYTKYKKQIKETGSGNTTTNYKWASQLTFLDNVNAHRVSGSSAALELKESPSSSPRVQTPSPNFDYLDRQDWTSRSTPAPHPLTPPSLEVMSTEWPANVSTASTSEVYSVGRVAQYLNAENRKEHDVIDYLFLSYADTFKKFPPREQAIVKLQLAELFSNTELKLLNSSCDI